MWSSQWSGRGTGPEHSTHLSQVLPSREAGTKDAVMQMSAEPSVKDGSISEAQAPLLHLDNILLELSILCFNLTNVC